MILACRLKERVDEGHRQKNPAIADVFKVLAGG